MESTLDLRTYIRQYLTIDLKVTIQNGNIVFLVTFRNQGMEDINIVFFPFLPQESHLYLRENGSRVEFNLAHLGGKYSYGPLDLPSLSEFSLPLSGKLEEGAIVFPFLGQYEIQGKSFQCRFCYFGVRSEIVDVFL